MNENDRAILSITSLGHGMVHAYELAIPIFITVWLVEFGVSPGLIGVVVAAGYALYGVGSVPSGVATDAYGSKWLLVGCLLGMGVAFVLLGFAGGVVGIGMALVVWGAAASIYHPAGLRLISTGVTRRGVAFGYHGIAGNLGLTLGPLAAAVLLIWIDWRVASVVLAVPAFAGAVYTARTRVDETAAVPGRAQMADGGDDERVSVAGLLRDSRVVFAGGFLLVFPVVVLEGFFYRGVLTFLPTLLAEYPALSPVAVWDRAVDPARYVFVGLLAVGMVGQYVGGWLSDRVRPERAVVGAFVSLAVLSVLFVPAAERGVVALLMVSGLLGFVLFGEQPLLQALVANYSGTSVRGLSYGYMFFGVFGVGSLGAAFSGAVLAYTTQQALFLLLAVVPLAAALLAGVLASRSGRLGRMSAEPVESD